jgi:predicted GNAT superfamily acetyltransferase
MGILLKKIETLAELEKISNLERKVWMMNPIPLHQTLTVAKNGGVLIGAFDGEQLVGFVYSFPGYADGEVYLCSHMMGIDSAYQNQGIGYRLKMKQAEEGAKNGYQKIRWTYDPLESRNGYLNIAKLGAVCSDYIENCYGEMTDELNKGLPSDRLNVEWMINSPYLQQRNPLFAALSLHQEATLLDWKLRPNGYPQALRKEIPLRGISNSSCLFIPIPVDFQQIKQIDLDLAIDWRVQTREVILQSFADGWAIAHVIRFKEEPVQYYVLVKKETLALI